MENFNIICILYEIYEKFVKKNAANPKNRK